MTNDPMAVYITIAYFVMIIRVPLLAINYSKDNYADRFDLWFTAFWHGLVYSLVWPLSVPVNIIYCVFRYFKKG